MQEQTYRIPKKKPPSITAQKGMAPHLHARRIFPPMRPESVYHAVIPTRISSTDNLMEYEIPHHNRKSAAESRHVPIKQPANFATFLPVLLFICSCPFSTHTSPEIVLLRVYGKYGSFIPFYSSQLFTVLGNGMTSRIFAIPVRYITQRSNPRPNPACLADPYLRRSR